jgi:hypothetical protein
VDQEGSSAEVISESEGEAPAEIEADVEDRAEVLSTESGNGEASVELAGDHPSDAASDGAAPDTDVVAVAQVEEVNDAGAPVSEAEAPVIEGSSDTDESVLPPRPPSEPLPEVTT